MKLTKFHKDTLLIHSKLSHEICAQCHFIQNGITKSRGGVGCFSGTSMKRKYPLMTKGRQFDNFVVTGGTVSCHNDNLQCHQWQQIVKLTIFCFQCPSFWRDIHHWVHLKVKWRLPMSCSRCFHKMFSPLVYTLWTWWRHQMETIPALLALCVGNSLVTGEFPWQRPVTRSFDVFFDLHLSKQSRCWWFETPSRSLWCHCNVIVDHSRFMWSIYPSFSMMFHYNAPVQMK